MSSRSIKHNTLFVSLVYLVGCGGGGSDGGNTTITYTVSTQVNGNGSISPSSRIVQAGNTTTFTITPTDNHEIASVTGCGGSLSGTNYTTGTITANCTVTANFSEMNTAPTFVKWDQDPIEMFNGETTTIVNPEFSDAQNDPFRVDVKKVFEDGTKVVLDDNSLTCEQGISHLEARAVETSGSNPLTGYAGETVDVSCNLNSSEQRDVLISNANLENVEVSSRAGGHELNFTASTQYGERIGFYSGESDSFQEKFEGFNLSPRGPLGTAMRVVNVPRSQDGSEFSSIVPNSVPDLQTSSVLNNASNVSGLRVANSSFSQGNSNDVGIRVRADENDVGGIDVSSIEGKISTQSAYGAADSILNCEGFEVLGVSTGDDTAEFRLNENDVERLFNKKGPGFFNCVLTNNVGEVNNVSDLEFVVNPFNNTPPEVSISKVGFVDSSFADSCRVNIGGEEKIRSAAECEKEFEVFATDVDSQELDVRGEISLDGGESFSSVELDSWDPQSGIGRFRVNPYESGESNYVVRGVASDLNGNGEVISTSTSENISVLVNRNSIPEVSSSGFFGADSDLEIDGDDSSVKSPVLMPNVSSPDEQGDSLEAELLRNGNVFGTFSLGEHVDFSKNDFSDGDVLEARIKDVTPFGDYYDKRSSILPGKLVVRYENAPEIQEGIVDASLKYEGLFRDVASLIVEGFSAYDKQDGDLTSSIEYRLESSSLGQSVVISSSNMGSVLANFSGASDVRLVASVSDSSGREASVDVDIGTVHENRAPTSSVSSLDCMVGDVLDLQELVTVVDPEGDLASHNGGNYNCSTEGNFSETLTLEDEHGASREHEVSISVNSIPNVPPTASISGSPDFVRIDGNPRDVGGVYHVSVSGEDSDGDIVGYEVEYRINSGPFIPVGTSPNFGLQLGNQGGNSVTFRGRAQDDAGAWSDWATYSIDVHQNQAPTSSVSSLECMVGDVLDLQQEIPVVDPEGDSASHDGGNYNCSSAGNYTSSVTLTDEHGASREHEFSVSINSIPNVPPTASISGSPDFVRIDGNPRDVGGVYHVSVSGEDSDGDIVGYEVEYRINSGPFIPVGTSPNFGLQLGNQGGNSVTFRGRAQDDAGAWSDWATYSIDVHQNQAPEYLSGTNNVSCEAGENISLPQGSFEDPEGDSFSQEYEVGGNVQSSSSYTCPSQAGSLEYRIKATDQYGASSYSPTRTISVTEPVNNPPIFTTSPEVIWCDNYSNSNVDIISQSGAEWEDPDGDDVTVTTNPSSPYTCNNSSPTSFKEVEYTINLDDGRGGQTQESSIIRICPNGYSYDGNSGCN